MPHLRLRLYVVGNAPNSVRAVTNVRAICGEHFADRHDLEIVDLLAFPRRAVEDGIIVTPTLLKLCKPLRRLIGDLSDTKQVLIALGRA
ncbi:MAG: circadian clock protein KaiB [Deltaproteobacteria bacterium]|nr:circadian clock protein KaiB [Deltaproteobacteria bacterium]